MKIRPDPNKSIFRTNPNSAFFNQTKNSKNDIIVMAKGDPTKFNYNDEGDNIINQSPSPFNSKKNDFLNKTQPNLKNKNNIDENNSITNNKILIKNKNDGNKSKYDYKEYKKMSDKGNDKDCINEIRTKYNKNKNIENKKINIKKRGINNVNRNKQKENNKNNVGFADKNKKLDSVLINKLLSQMNNLSSKQLSLIDVMENIQNDSNTWLSKYTKMKFVSTSTNSYTASCLLYGKLKTSTTWSQIPVNSELTLSQYGNFFVSTKSTTNGQNSQCIVTLRFSIS